MLLGGRRAVDSTTRTGYSAYALRNTVAGNFVLGGVLGGIGVQGYSAVGAAMQVAGNHLEVAGTGITVALDGCTVADNHVTQLDAATALSVASHPAGALPTPGILISPSPAPWRSARHASSAIASSASAVLAFRSMRRCSRWP